MYDFTLGFFSPDDLSRFPEALTIMLVGMGVVFFTLAVIGEGIGLLSKLINYFEKPSAAPSPEPAPSSSDHSLAHASHEPPAPSTEIDPQILVLLTAATYAFLEKPVVIHTVRRIPTSAAWTAVGRQQIHSHETRH